MDKKKLVELYKSRKSSELEKGENGVEHRPSKEASKNLKDFFSEINYIHILLHWQKICLLLSVILLIAVWITVISTSREKEFVLDLKPTPSELLKKYNITEQISKDNFSFFVKIVLQTLHEEDDSGSPYRKYLLGMINPMIYESIQDQMDGNKGIIKENNIVQLARIDNLKNIAVDTETGNISAYAMGYKAILVQDPSRGSENYIIPYRAEIICNPNIPNGSNPFNYYLAKIEEKIGDDALIWDEEKLNTGKQSPK